MISSFLLIGLFGGFVSCDNPVNSEMAGSTFALVSVNGSTLPHPLRDEGNTSYLEVLADTLQFTTSSTLTLYTTMRAVHPWIDTVYVTEFTAAYEHRRNGQLYVKHIWDWSRSIAQPITQETGRLQGDTLTMSREWHGSPEDRVLVRVSRD